VAVSGEITLRGNVLPVENVKDQVLAAHRAGVRQIVLPAKNRVDLDEVPSEVRDDITVHLVQRIDEVLALVLGDPEPGDSSDDDEPSHENEAQV
jgi:ATP-dependent Lon protease